MTNNSDENIVSAKSEKKEFLIALLSFLGKLFAVVCAIVICLLFVFGIYIVHDNDNYPIVRDGDLLVIYKLYDLEDYRAGDLVAYEYDNNTYIGRVAGIGGDTVEITDKTYLINGMVPHENIFYETKPAKIGVEYPVEVPYGQFFILADYRDVGKDSRIFGTISNVKGKVIFQMCHRGF